MRFLLLFIFIISYSTLAGQSRVSGKVVNAETSNPLAYARLMLEDGRELLTNIDGSFDFTINQPLQVNIFYTGFFKKTFEISPATEHVTVRMDPTPEAIPTVELALAGNPANHIIQKAIDKKFENNPDEVLDDYEFKTYTKFIIDKPGRDSEVEEVEIDSINVGLETIISSGQAFLSEKVSVQNFNKNHGKKERVLALNVPGFQDPVYEILALEVNPFSLYQKDYSIFKTDYAAPLAKNALKNYVYRVLDTTKSFRPAYVIYFKPKREKAVAGLEGILHLDTTSYAIQQAKAQLLGAVELEVQHNYKYYPEENLWFPENQTTTIRPGIGGKEISVFGGVIPVGTLQPRNELINAILTGEKSDPDLFLTSTAYNYEIAFNTGRYPEYPSAEIEVLENADNKGEEFWRKHRWEPLSRQDSLTAKSVENTVSRQNIERKLQVKKSITAGYYPWGFWDFELAKFFKFNNYEGIRLGAGGKTNENFSEKFSLGGYLVYGFKDEVFKYNLNTSIFLNKATGTNLNFGYTRDIREVGSFEYLKGVNDFSILEPRFVNIDFFYNNRSLSAGLEHRFSSRLESELRFSHSSISHIKDYRFRLNGENFTEYEITQARLSFLWRPFSKFLRTPTENILVEKRFPKFTAEIDQAFKGTIGDFDFTKFGLKVEHEIKRLDNSRTEFILEGNYAIGDLPLSHIFHAYPNNPRRDAILRRFAVAGRNSFETMYYNEFFSDKQAMLHIRHQLRPINISREIQPELVFISRHAIGDISDKERHANISFRSLKHGFSEFGLELNKILMGFGLSVAYRYGAYHLPTFNENFAFKFTFQLEL